MTLPLKKRIAVMLMLAGGALTLLGVGADYLGIGGAAGMGPRQIAILVTGTGFLLIGIIMYFRISWRDVLLAGPRLTAGQFALGTLWFGLLIGFGDVLVFIIRIKVMGVLSVNPHLFWLKAITNPVLFGVIGTALYLLTRQRPHGAPLRLAVLVYMLCGSVALLVNVPGLHNIAALVLALGLTVQSARLISRHADGFRVFARRSLPWMVGMVVLICVGVYVWKLPKTPNSEQASSPQAESPNVLLLVLDTVRAQSLSLHGYDRPTTPRLEEFAKTGVTFERALSTSPWTLPAHGSMFTGRLPYELFGEHDTPLNATIPLRPKYPTLAEVLAKRGYLTAGFVANTSYCSYAHGLDRGFRHYEDYVYSHEWLLGSSSLGGMLYSIYRNMVGDVEWIGRKYAEDVNQAFLDWLDEQQDERPFFAFLNYFDAHNPYFAPEPFKLKFGSKMPENPFIIPGYDYNEEQIRDFRDAYDSCIAYIDHEMGRLFDELKQRGRLENSLVIVTSDHGEHFGEHGLMSHTNSLYRPLLHVPLVMSLPGRIPGGQRLAEPVSIRDLPATVIDILPSTDFDFPGQTLARYWDETGVRETAGNGRTDVQFAEVLVGEGKPDWWPESWPIDKGSMQAIVSDGHHYITNGDGQEEIYDFKNDPEEANNIVDTEEGQTLREQFRALLESLTRNESIRAQKL